MKKNYVNLKRNRRRLQALLLLACMLLNLCLLSACGAEQDTSAQDASSQTAGFAASAVPVQEESAEPEPASDAEEASAEEEASVRTLNEADSGSTYETATVTASSLNMRKKATTDADVVEQLTMGTKVEVMGAGNYWAKVRAADGKVGYVDVDYLFIGEPDVEPYEIMLEASKYLGVPYVWGGSSPDGFDCSGFTQYVYIQLGLYLPRVADDQFDMGTPVDEDDLQFGDLVFFGSGDYATHVGIYYGAGCFIHASNSGIAITSLKKQYYADRYIGARRILEDTDEEDPDGEAAESAESAETAETTGKTGKTGKADENQTETGAQEDAESSGED